MSEGLQCQCGAPLPNPAFGASIICGCGRKYERTVDLEALIRRVDAIDGRLAALEPQAPSGSMKCPDCAYAYTDADLDETKRENPFQCPNCNAFGVSSGPTPHFQECSSCSEKSGSPALCYLCVARRAMHQAFGCGPWSTPHYKGAICSHPHAHRQKVRFDLAKMCNCFRLCHPVFR